MEALLPNSQLFECPDPIVRVAIEPKDKADADKMANGLTKLAQEIPSIQISRGYEMTFIKGTGELDLDIIVDRLKREFKVSIMTSCIYALHTNQFLHIYAK